MSSDDSTLRAIPAVPLTLEGHAVLHQMFRVRRDAWRALDANARTEMISQARSVLDQIGRFENGESAAFQGLGHKGELTIVHFRRTFDEIGAAQNAIARLKIHDYLEQTTSYLSVIEIGLYEASLEIYRKLADGGLSNGSDEWRAAISSELGSLRAKMASRLFPRIPARRYLCFYPMDKKREGADNWYRMPIADRRRLMQEHGTVGRRYAGEVTQIISGSIGFDDYEWAVDLFADDPLVFKRLVYEMRFDEASAGYARFGPFYFGIRLGADGLEQIFAV
jgi:chlorite dismutase